MSTYAPWKQQLRTLSPLVILSVLILFLFAFDASLNSPATTPPATTSHTVSVNNGPTISYDSNPQNLIIRTFYGGGRLGTLELSPEISIYGDGSYILGPGLTMQEGQLTTEALDQLLRSLVETDGLLSFSQQQFYDIPDQNATFLQLNIDQHSYNYLYGPFGNLSESAQALDEYKRLGTALTRIRNLLNGPLHPYGGSIAVLLVHQDFSPDLSQTIANWSVPDIDLANLAIYECGAIPQDQTGPNPDNGCLTYTVPAHALVLNAQQQQAVFDLLGQHMQGTVLEGGLYYSAALRALLPDEFATNTLAMLGSSELSYTGIPLSHGPVPTPAPTQ
jgi:hypothetical protein